MRFRRTGAIRSLVRLRVGRRGLAECATHPRPEALPPERHTGVDRSDRTRRRSAHLVLSRSGYFASGARLRRRFDRETLARLRRCFSRASPTSALWLSRRDERARARSRASRCPRSRSYTAVRRSRHARGQTPRAARGRHKHRGASRGRCPGARRPATKCRGTQCNTEGGRSKSSWGFTCHFQLPRLARSRC